MTLILFLRWGLMFHLQVMEKIGHFLDDSSRNNISKLVQKTYLEVAALSPEFIPFPAASTQIIFTFSLSK